MIIHRWYASLQPPPMQEQHAKKRGVSQYEGDDAEIEVHDEESLRGQDDFYSDDEQDILIDEPDEGQHEDYQEVEEQGAAPYIETANSQPVRSDTLANGATSLPAIPDPPSLDEGLSQDPSFLMQQSPEEALQKALHAWYAAGYATALYHARQGLVQL